jgi:hypothetical protein
MFHFHTECYNDSHPVAQEVFTGPSQDTAPKKPRRKPQSAAVRAEIVAAIEAARATAAHLESDAGPTLVKEIDATKIIERAVDQHRLRETMTTRLLSQRAGLFKLCNAECSSADFDQPTARVKLYFDRMLKISANIGAVSGTGWPAAWGWFRDRLPLPSDRIGAKVLEAQFNDLLAKATATIAGRPILRLWDLQTAPSAKELAETFGTTMAQLRAAKATRCQLTAIDAPPKKVRDRVAKEAKRRAAGMQAQADRHTRERDQELAILAEVSDRWIRKHRLAGTLADFLASKGIDAPESASSQKCRSPKENKKRQKWELTFAHHQSMTPVGGLRPRQAPMTWTAGPGGSFNAYRLVA